MSPSKVDVGGKPWLWNVKRSSQVSHSIFPADDDDYDANDTVSSGLLGDSSTSSSAIREAGTKDGKNKTKKRGKKSKKQKKTKKSSGKEAPAMNTVMADVV